MPFEPWVIHNAAYNDDGSSLGTPMKHYFVLLFLCFFMLGQSECESPTPPPPPPLPPAPYCAGARMPAAPEPAPAVSEFEAFLDTIIESIERNAVLAWSTIVGGTPSVDRRSTMLVYMPGQGRCTGVVLTPHTIITAAHCRGKVGHRVYLSYKDLVNDGNNPDKYWDASSVLEHPDYASWRDYNSLEGRKSDLMLMYFDKPLPGPFPNGIFNETYTAICEGLTAQGWGQTEAIPNEPCPAGEPLCLRESDYTVTLEGEKVIRTKQATWGGICFGDSGGPLYATLIGIPGTYLVGITSTTQTKDCLVASTHIKVEHFADWIEDNTRP